MLAGGRIAVRSRYGCDRVAPERRRGRGGLGARRGARRSRTRTGRAAVVSARGHVQIALTAGCALEYPSRMAHLFEPAASGRSKCRGCTRPIQRGELRFGERVPNVFGEGETTLWFHPLCAAHKRPQPLLEALAGTGDRVPDREDLERVAQGSLAHERLQR